MTNDDSAASIARQQSLRLRRLRERFGLIADEYPRSGLSRDAWGRMERGDARIDPVGLMRWCASHGIGPSYVISGQFDGLPADVVRELVLAELEDERAASDTVPGGGAAPSRNPRLEDRRGTARRRVRREDD